MEEKKSLGKVCVTGGAGFIGSWLVKKLLEKGYFVNATLRNLNDALKVGVLKELPYAEARLSLFQADIYDSNAFELAIEGCECIFYVATPLQHTSSEDYINSKTLVEQEVLRYNDKENFGLDVVTLVCSMVGGDTLLPYLAGSQEAILSPLTGASHYYKFLKLLQELSGSIPLAHIDDVCEAHIFCMENPFINGRVLCAQAYPALAQVEEYYREIHLELRLTEELMGEKESRIRGSSTKLTDLGFEYKYDLKKMLDDTVNCAKRLGSLQ